MESLSFYFGTILIGDCYFIDHHSLLEDKMSSHQKKKFFFSCPEASSDQKDFIFVHQNAWQKELLRKYGLEICLLDSTYNTTKYEMPCFFICVQTNYSYINVAMIIIEHETKESLAEALRIVQEWNPNWHPEHFITDYDEREIGAVETVFAGNILMFDFRFDVYFSFVIIFHFYYFMLLLLLCILHLF